MWRSLLWRKMIRPVNISSPDSQTFIFILLFRFSAGISCFRIKCIWKLTLARRSRKQLRMEVSPLASCHIEIWRTSFRKCTFPETGNLIRSKDDVEVRDDFFFSDYSVRIPHTSFIHIQFILVYVVLLVCCHFVLTFQK